MKPGALQRTEGALGGALSLVNAPANRQGQQHPQGCVAALPCIGNAPFSTHLSRPLYSRLFTAIVGEGALRCRQTITQPKE